MSERITWERCPACGGTAAVGWDGVRPVEIDCLHGCLLPQAGVAEVLAAVPGRCPHRR